MESARGWERHPQIVPGDGGTGPPSPPSGGKKGVKDPYHSEASLPGRSTVAGRIFEEEAGLGRDARPFRRQTVESRVPLFYSQLSGGVDGLKAVQKAVVLQGGAAQGRHAGGEHRHPCPPAAAGVQKGGHAGLQGQSVSIGGAGPWTSSPP